MRETNFVGETIVVEWAIFVGRTPDWEGFQRWLNNLVDARNIGRWVVKGLLGFWACGSRSYDMGVSLRLLGPIHSEPPIACTC